MDSCVREQADDVTNDSELFKILLNHIEHQIKYPQQEVIMWLFDGAHPVKIDLDKKLDDKQKTIQTFNIDTKGFRKIMKILQHEAGVTSKPVPANLPMVGRTASIG